MRKPQVTRTIITTQATVLCLNVETGEPFNETVIVPRTYKDDKKLMKKINELVDTEVVKAVHIVDKVEVSTLYGMSEEEFIKVAKVLPPRNGASTEDGEAEAE